MRFWDASAITPLLVRESTTRQITALLKEDRGMVAWWASRVECVSAVRRRGRDGVLETAEMARALERLDLLSANWTEMHPGAKLRSLAERALAVHPLRAGDALQLAAALVWREGDPAGAGFVCLDDRLRDVAAREGFGVLPAAP